MNTEQAINFLDQVTSTISAPRQVHAQIQEAIRTVRNNYDASKLKEQIKNLGNGGEGQN